MKLFHSSIITLCLLLSSGLVLQPIYAETETETASEETQQESETEAEAPEADSKEAKRAMLMACQKVTADEFKAIRQLANMLKKAKNEKDYTKINKAADEIIKKYSSLYTNNQPMKVNGVEVTVEDLAPSHTKLGSKRKKLYKDFLEFSENQREKQERNNNMFDNQDETDKEKEKKAKKKKAKAKAKEKEKADESIHFDKLDTIKGFIRINQETFADKYDAELEEKEAKKK